MRNLNIAPFGLGSMLANSHFAVPTYQRSYAWSEDHVTNLLTDLSAAIKRRQGGRADVYFVGSIVVVQRERDRPYEVVDGQQRLATISVILAAIRDYHLSIGQKAAAEQYDKYLRTLHVPTGKLIPKLRLNEIDDRCFSQAILEVPDKRKAAKWTIPSHKKLIKAYECAQSYIAALASVHSKRELVSVLFEFVEFIRENVQSIRVVVDDEADAFTVFETLNDRHLPLTVADLLKNFIFGLVGDDGIEEAKSHWRLMDGALLTIKGKQRIVDYIRQLWGSMHGLVREKDLFRDIKAKVLDEEQALELSRSLSAQAPDYAAVLNAHHELWATHGNVAREAIDTLNSLRVERFRPLLLAILFRFDQRNVGKSLEFLRSAAVRIVVTGGINGSIEEKLYDMAVQVHNGSIGDANALAKAMSAFVANDMVFEAKFATMTVAKPVLARFYLRELEEVAKGGEDGDREVSSDPRKVTLEHIIPVSATERESHWPELDSEIGASLCKRFGNQTLLGSTTNSSLNGIGFEEKKSAYAACEGIYITRHIARDYQSFGKEEVNDRQLKLAKFAVQRWPLTIPTKSSGKRGNRTRPA